MVSSSSTRTKVFISYSHKDAKYLHQLVEHLAYYERNNLIETWSDQKIVAGAQWREEIQQAIEAAKVAVLLISPSFLASTFIAENELPPLLLAAEKEGAIILPVIVRPSNFEDTELAAFQAVNNPSLPVAKMKGYQRDEFWTKVVRDIRSAIEAPIRKPELPLESHLDIGAVETKQLRENKFSQELSAEYDKQIQQQMMGVVDFRQAIDAHNWKQAEKVLQKYPNLPEGRSLLGLSMSDEVQEYFFSLLPADTTQTLQRLIDPVDDASMYYTSVYHTQHFLHQTEPPNFEAVQWLEEALKHQDNPAGQVTAALALMYGFKEEYEKMMKTVQEVRTNYPALLSYLQTPDHLMMLVYACNMDQARIQELVKLLDVSLPTEEEVRTALQKPPESIDKQFVDWYAVELYDGVNASKMPVRIRIFYPHIQETDEVTKALIYKLGHQPIPRPDYTKEPDPTHPSERAFDLPVDELLQQLFDEFFFLCPKELQIETNDHHTNEVAFISTTGSETKSSGMPSRAHTRETIDKSNPSKSLRKQTSLQIVASTVAIIVVIIFTIISVRACSSGAFNPSYEEPLSTSPSATPSIDTPSASLSPTNTPTLTTVTPGKILYYADWSNGSNGWEESKGWKIYHKELLNDGTYSGTDIEPTIVAPYTLGSVLNYAVEVRIKVDNYTDFPCFGIVVRNVGSTGYSVGMSCDDMQFSTIQITADLTGYNNVLAQQPFNPYNAWRTYRIEVKDNTIKLFIDGHTKPLLQAIDNKYLSDGGQAGLWCHNAQLEISSFKIVALK